MTSLKLIIQIILKFIHIAFNRKKLILFSHCTKSDYTILRYLKLDAQVTANKYREFF
jgi:hypothetical protein